MLNLIIPLAISLLLAAGLTLLAGLKAWISSLIAMVVFAILYFLMLRHTLKKLGQVMEVAQRDLQAQRVDKAIRVLEGAFKYGRWQFFIKNQIHSQIGSIYYMKRDFAKAFDHLKQGFTRHWVGMAMLGICYLKKHKTDAMISTFEKAVAGTRKEPLLWNLYAYCLEEADKHQKAIDVMTKGIKKCKGDENLEANLQALKEGRRMKMRAYGDMWYQFHLEKPGAIIKQQTKAVAGRRRTIQRR